YSANAESTIHSVIQSRLEVDMGSNSNANVADSFSSGNFLSGTGSDPQTNRKIFNRFRLHARGRVHRRVRQLRKRWEREAEKNRALPAPFGAVHISDKRQSICASLLLLFSTMQCICGFVFPICDAFALNETWTQFAINHKYYMETFLLSQYVGAVAALAFLQFLIYCYSEPYGMFNAAPTKSLPHLESDTTYDQLHVANAKVMKRRNKTTRARFNINGSSDAHGQTDFTVDDAKEKDKRRNHWNVLKVWRRHYQSSLKTSKFQRLTWDKDGMNLYMRLGAVGFGLGVMIHDGFNISSAWELEDRTCHSVLWIPKHVIRLIWVLWQTYFVFKYHRAVFHVHTFSARFAFAHLAVVNLCQWLKVVVAEISGAISKDSLESPVRAVQRFLSTVLTTDNMTHTHGSGLPHHGQVLSEHNVTVMAGNMTHQIDFGQIFTQMRDPCKGYLGEKLKPFLFPLAIEYSLITGSLFYKMLQRIGQNTTPIYSRRWETSGRNESTTSFGDVSRNNNLSTYSLCTMGNHASVQDSFLFGDGSSSVDLRIGSRHCLKHTQYRQVWGCRVYLPPDISDTEQPAGGGLYSGQTSKFPDNREDAYCHRSHTGLFLGLMLFTGSTIGIIFFLSSRERSSPLHFNPYIYQHSKIMMLTFSLLACLIAVVQTNQLKFRRIKPGESFEYNLLGLGLLGYLTYHMLLFVPSLETVVHAGLYRSTMSERDFEQPVQAPPPVALFHIEDLGGVASLYIVKCAFEVLQALSQFFFIVEASRRGPCCRNQTIIKPGRSAIVFLLITNLALWLMNTLEVREAEHQLKLHRLYYGKRTWSVITCCFIPLIIFFRFHSTVCLAQLWSKLYKLE
ncbi:unnamed protein product, partial [Calicophoron daubneyi]